MHSVDRTIYSGPFILPGQAPLDFINNQYVCHQAALNVNNFASVCYTSTAPVLDESCQPVFNLSFLDESASERHLLSQSLHNEVNHYVVNNGVIISQATTQVNDVPSHLPNGIDSNAQQSYLQPIQATNIITTLGPHLFYNVPILNSINTSKTDLCRQSTKRVQCANDKKWRKATHGDVLEKASLNDEQNVEVLENTKDKKTVSMMDQFSRRRKGQESPYDNTPKHFREDRLPIGAPCYNREDRLPSRAPFYKHSTQRLPSRDYCEDVGPPNRFDTLRNHYYEPHPYEFDLFHDRIFDRERGYDRYATEMDVLPPRLYPPIPRHELYPPWDFPIKDLDFRDRPNERPLSPFSKHWLRREIEQRHNGPPALRKHNYRKYSSAVPHPTPQDYDVHLNKERPDGKTFQGPHCRPRPIGAIPPPTPYDIPPPDIPPPCDIPSPCDIPPPYIPPPCDIPPLCDFTALRTQEKQSQPAACTLPVDPSSKQVKTHNYSQPVRKFRRPPLLGTPTPELKKEEDAKALFAKHLQKFATKLKHFPEKENAIQTYENCLMSCHLPINTFYVVTDVVQANKKPCFSGVLYINDLFITRACSPNKKSLKHNVYESAVDLLKTKTVAELLAQKDPGVVQKETKVVQGGNILNEESLQLKLKKLQDHIKKQPVEGQPFTTLTLAFTESQCGLRLSFDYEALQTERGVNMYTKCIVHIEDQPFVNAIALSRKESKVRACQKAITIFCNSDVETIIKEYCMSQVPKDDIPKEIQELIKKHREKNAMLKQSLIPTEQEYGDLLDKMINDLKSPSKQKVNSIMTIDKHCVQLKIKLLTVYKMVQLSEDSIAITCDLYIVDRFIAQGSGQNRKTAQLNAYNLGAEILRNSTGLQVLSTFPKFDEVELKKPEVVDIVYKGYSKMYESNLCRLNRLKQLPEEKRRVSDLVIIEHEEWSVDRKKHSHCILNQSATQCGCLLEWITEPDNGCFRCTMKLQGEEISTCLGKQRKIAVNLASSKALFQLLETQPLVHRSRAKFPSQWCTRTELVKLSSNFTDDKTTVLVDGKQEIDQKIAKVIEGKLDDLFCISTLEEFVTAPDWLPAEKKYLKYVSSLKGLRVLSEIYCEETLLVVSKKYDLLQIVEILKEQPNKTHGRYRLVPDEEKPSYNDIAGELAANDSIIREIVGTDGAANQAAAHVVEEEDQREDDLTLDSDGEAFITANTIIVDSPTHSKQLQTAELQIDVSEIPLPKSSSTPSKTRVKKLSDSSQTSFTEGFPSRDDITANMHYYYPMPSQPVISSEYGSFPNQINNYSSTQESMLVYNAPNISMPLGTTYNHLDVEAGQITGENKDWRHRLKNTVAHWKPGYQKVYEAPAPGTTQTMAGPIATYMTYTET